MNLKSALVLAALAMLLSCPLPGRAEGSRIFLVSHAGAGDPFWKIEFRGAMDAAKMCAAQLTILAPDIPNDIVRQTELLEQAIAAAPDGIATTISHPTALTSKLRLARERGIPVVAFNALPHDVDRLRTPFLAYIGMNDHSAGEAAARRALASGRLRTRVAVAVQQPGLTGLTSRLNGLRNIFEEQGIIVDALDVTSDPDVARQVVTDHLRLRPDTSGLICLGPIGTHALAPLVKKRGSALYFASFDITPLTVQLIREGTMDFTVDQQPYMQGFMSVMLLDLAARYALTPADIDTGVGIVDAENVETVRALARENVR
ncbi:simple sugar transport system substrate-binding protein [Desulfobaculum xiamenense]|uniref:Simple sugar transport system substrate-binding protein n=1 Tax=Desulfobaculum xiamenense TaxID=995050 RepID=A0A846QM61_9BACT|nr:substrate-binding domain-containing protein [Desulfobaculum xiamenense]NJB68120.1 simple sugar transport system substrate-binding protein [Desulfobaculum xiamenense]